MVRPPPRSTRTDTRFPTRRSSDLQHCDWLGVCFHVGSQAMSPFAFVQALDRTRAAIAQAGVVIDMIDVGGGFPSIYPGLEPPAMEEYFAIIARHFEALPIAYNTELWRSEEHKSEFQYIMHNAYADLRMKK